ncbi:MAG: DUF1573 domain-containing protein [Saprospiraceae bacterium]|nr:DUF1573 domain-containing protein [Saprospiraceae bacterium]
MSFGTIKEDSVVVKKFAFTNMGEKNLVIVDVSVTCGCTFPTFPIQPIPPKGTGEIEVKYTAKNKFGPQKPVITVITNSEPRVKKLILEGWVEQIPGGVKN